MTEVIDGDTIEAEFGGDPYHIRYIGIDTPERGRPFWSEAKAANETLVGGQHICAAKDSRDRDDFNRLLRYVWRSEDALFVNAELVRLGYARAYAVPPDTPGSELFAWLEWQAYSARVGQWGLPRVFLPITGLRGCVDINTASPNELQLLDGIGPVLAQRIVDGRPYQSLDDLERVPGIGPATIEKIKAQGLACVRLARSNAAGTEGLHG